MVPVIGCYGIYLEVLLIRNIPSNISRDDMVWAIKQIDKGYYKPESVKVYYMFPGFRRFEVIYPGTESGFGAVVVNWSPRPSPFDYRQFYADFRLNATNTLLERLLPT